MSFNGICSKVALSLCSVYGPTNQNIPECYARNADSNSKLIFNPSTLFLHIVVFLAVAFMIYQTNFKQWGASRKQMLLIMSLYLLAIFFDLFLLGHIIPATSGAFKVFVGFQIGTWNALFWSILVLGMMPLFNIEDLRIMSYITTAVIGLVVSIISILTAFDAGPFKSDTPVLVFIFFVVVNIIFVALFLASQIYVVLAKTTDRYLLGILGFCLVFFSISLLMLGVSSDVCQGKFIDHYVDGIFFSTIFNLLSIMMIYKYWDSLNQQEVEFVRDDDDIQQKKSEYFSHHGSSSFANSQDPLIGQ